MEITKHCQLCDHQEIDFKTGTYCGITKRKPDFYGKCINAKFDKKLETAITSTHIEYQKIVKTKRTALIKFFTFSIIGVLAIITGYYLVNHLFTHEDYDYYYFRFVATAAILLLLGSLLFIFPLATKPLINYLNDYKLVKRKKEILSKVLNIYGIKYTINMSSISKSSAHVDVKIDLKIKK